MARYQLWVNGRDTGFHSKEHLMKIISAVVTEETSRAPSVKLEVSKAIL
tara:strand:- start:102 stop:248 length:147 start_codon:yes stop_codon:yes gene_type:complete